jgi:hypothetical protein
MSQEREQIIRERAYAIWEQDGCPEGRCLAHWSQAEAEIGNEPVVAVRKQNKLVKSRRARAVTKPFGDSCST